jgi:hypothetical protein
VRQHFSHAELGVNKARALAERYALAFGIAPEYLPEFVESPERLKALIAPETMDLPHGVWNKKTKKTVFSVEEFVILIGATDNNKSRFGFSTQKTAMSAAIAVFRVLSNGLERRAGLRGIPAGLKSCLVSSCLHYDSIVYRRASTCILAVFAAERTGVRADNLRGNPPHPKKFVELRAAKV